MKSLNSLIYPAIFNRKSTRSYGDIPTPVDKLHGLREFMQEVVPLFPSEQAAFEIQPHKGKTLKIAAYAKNEVVSSINLAFMLQQIDLFLQANGIGVVWNATVRATNKQCQELPYRICLVFGMAKESPIRTNTAQFDRKHPEEISNKPNLHIVEAVRLAPSTQNRQPWYLICNEKCIDFYCKKGGFIDNTLLKGLHWFDIGIAVCHAVLDLQQDNFSPSASIKSNVPNKEEYNYIVSLNY